jgi:hypothetical protein
MRGSRLFGLLAIAAAAFGALVSTASAQESTLIYWNGPSPYPDSMRYYKVAGDGTGFTHVNDYIRNTFFVTSLSSYPGGRRFFTEDHYGPTVPVPNGSNHDCLHMVLLSEQNGFAPLQFTDFRGQVGHLGLPEYIVSGHGLVSNDGLDRFVSFQTYHPSTGQSHIVRYNGPVSDFFAPGFVPFVPGDPRLTYVYSFPWGSPTSPGGDLARTWDSTGTKLIIESNDNKTLWLVDALSGSATVLANTSSGLTFGFPLFSTTEYRIFSGATSATGEKGIISLDPVTGGWSWLIKEGGNGKNWVGIVSGGKTSPDGTRVALTIVQNVKGGSQRSIASIPVDGGAITKIFTLPPGTGGSLTHWVRQP